MSKLLENMLGQEELKKIWEKSDDAWWTVEKLKDIYPDLPVELDTSVHVLTVYAFQEHAKEKIISWLNERKIKNE